MAAKKKTAKKTSKLPVPEQNYVVKSVCKELLKEFDVNVGGDAFDGLNNVVMWHLQQAAQRAQANGRKTVRAHDFVVMG